VLARELLVLDEVAPEVLFGGEGIACGAAHTEVRNVMLTARGERLQVVKLEVVRFNATLSRRRGIATSVVVSLEDGAANRGGNVPPAPALKDPRIVQAQFRRLGSAAETTMALSCRTAARNSSKGRLDS
jgi:hypothetical protein